MLFRSRIKVDAKKAAGYIVVTEEMLKWRSRAWAQIQRLFNDKVWRDYEKLLTEDLLSNATAYTTTVLDDTIAAPTDFDAIVASVLQLESLEYRPDVLIINPADKWKLALTQANNGTFILPYIQNGNSSFFVSFFVKVKRFRHFINNGNIGYIMDVFPATPFHK